MARRGNNEGSISKRKDGRWMARYTVHALEGPKQKTIMGKKGESRKEVAEKLTKAQADRDGGMVYEGENLTLGEYLDRWLSGSVRGSVRQSTYERYEIALRVHLKPVLGRIKLKNLSPARVAAFYQDRLDSGQSPASVNKLHVTLHKALKQAVRWNMLPRNVCEAVDAPRPAPEEIETLSAEQVRSLLVATSGDRLEALYILAVHAGLREGELLALKWEDVDLDTATLQVRRTLSKAGTGYRFESPKSGKGRKIKLTHRATQGLRAHRKAQLEERMGKAGLWEDHGLVFPSEAGTIINPTNLRKRSFARLLERAGLPKVRFHNLRHTCATLLFSRNTHPKHVQELLGHANIKITLDTYSHAIPGMGDQTARAMEDALAE